MTASVRSYAGIAGALRSPYAVDDLAGPSGVPLLAVRVDDGGPSPEEAGVLRNLPLVTVAVLDRPSRPGAGGAAVTGPTAPPTAGPPGAAAFDVVLSDGDGRAGAALDAIAARVSANPQASVAAVQLLRLSGPLVVDDGLVAESFTYSTLQAGREFASWLSGRPAPGGPPSTGRDPLVVEREGDELRITFDRPEVHNAFGTEMRDALVEALRLPAADTTIRSIVLAGRGPSFCSGGDLREFGTLGDPTTAHVIRTTRSAAHWLHRVRDRLSARVHGHCIGSGVELAAFAGRVTAAPDLTVALPEVGMGLVPGAGGTVSLPRRIGRHRTAYLCLTGERIDAPTALAWGLVDEVRPGPPDRPGARDLRP